MPQGMGMQQQQPFQYHGDPSASLFMGGSQSQFAAPEGHQPQPFGGGGWNPHLVTGLVLVTIPRPNLSEPELCAPPCACLA